MGRKKKLIQTSFHQAPPPWKKNELTLGQEETHQEKAFAPSTQPNHPSSLFPRMASMLAFDVLRGLMTDPDVAQSLRFDHLIQFSCLASDLLRRNKEGLGLTSDKQPLRFLQSSLPSELHQHLDVLWKTTFHVLPNCYINPSEKIDQFGILPALHDGLIPPYIPYKFALPPIERDFCPRCQRKATLEHTTLSGYLYDIDGYHAVRHTSYYCRAKGLCYGF